MFRKLIALAVVATVGSLAWQQAYAQRGQGGTGVAQQSNPPAVEQIVGTIQEVKIAPCENAQGRQPVGVHLIVVDDSGVAHNVHLGPYRALQEKIVGLGVGDAVDIDAFTTPALGSEHYVAQSLTSGDLTLDLRNNALKPDWSGPRNAGNRQQAFAGGGMGRGPQAGRGNGTGRGNGNGKGKGPANGGGRGNCRGACQAASAAVSPGDVPAQNAWGQGPRNGAGNAWAGAGRGMNRGRGRGQGWGYRQAQSPIDPSLAE
ncbi:MAG: hypothetical protein KDA61_17830 [Planctomycetales bacterium]|nr:hypothetical protein [Planctomycetales bacterium]